MPISTSVITGTVAHKHSSASAEGGYLDEGVTGITGGNVGEVLTATATDIPQWLTPAEAQGGWNVEGNDIATSFQSELAVSVTDQDVYQINYNVSDGGGDYNALVMRINDITTSTYKALLSQGVASGGSQGDPELTTQDKCMITGESIERQCN